MCAIPGHPVHHPTMIHWILILVLIIVSSSSSSSSSSWAQPQLSQGIFKFTPLSPPPYRLLTSLSTAAVGPVGPLSRPRTSLLLLLLLSLQGPFSHYYTHETPDQRTPRPSFPHSPACYSHVVSFCYKVFSLLKRRKKEMCRVVECVGVIVGSTIASKCHSNDWHCPVKLTTRIHQLKGRGRGRTLWSSQCEIPFRQRKKSLVIVIIVI